VIVPLSLTSTVQDMQAKVKGGRLRGTFVDTPTLGELRIYHDHVLCFSSEGYITRFEPFSNTSDNTSDHDQDTQRIPAGSFLIPTFTDLHLHAPQYLYQGTGLDLPLMQWLDTYTYAAEERLDADSELARKVYGSLAKRLLRNGTGAVSFFGTIKNDTKWVFCISLHSVGGLIISDTLALFLQKLCKPLEFEQE
jgi:guanine deaminase